MTKIFLLLTLVFFTSPYGKSISVRLTDKALVIEVTKTTPHANVSSEPYFSNTDHYFIIGTIPGEEDGKMHYFHFDRINGTRRKIWWRTLLRGLLLFAHMGCIIYEVLASHS